MSRIGKAYETLDQALVGAAGKLSQAYNWTTGRTKTDLANKMLTVAPVLESVGVIALDKMIGGMTAPLVILASHSTQKNNIEIENYEEQMMETGTINPQLTLEYEAHKRAGEGSFFGALTIPTISAFIDDPILRYSASITSAGVFIRGASSYVMRSDSLPPRKNVISRTKDKLADLVTDYKPKPAMVPALATMRNNPVIQNP